MKKLILTLAFSLLGLMIMAAPGFGAGLVSEVFGNIPAHLWVAAIIFGAIGVTLNIGIGVAYRDKTIAGREKLDKKIFWDENGGRMVWRIIVSTLVFFVFLRFFKEFTGQTIASFWAFITGFGLDFLVQSFKKKRFDWFSKINPK